MQQPGFRLLHTSDWHLGQHFFGKSRQAEHQQFLDWLLATAVKQQVNAIVVAGDIFDTGAPPSYARQLYNQFIVKLQPTGIHLIVLGGNHDSVAMLSESKGLLACLNTHVIPNASDDINQQVLTLNDKNAKPQAIICAIPFLRPRDILRSSAGQTGAEKQQQLQQAISDHYHEIFAIAKARQEEVLKNQGLQLPIIATGHLTTVGAKSSESVRDIYIGSLEAFPSSGFPPADYIALGHIHRPQLVGGAEHIRYCGSPIALSFDELNNNKTVLLVDFNAGKFSAAQPLVVPRFQAMHCVEGGLEAIEQSLKQLAAEHLGETPAWLDIEVTTQDYLNDLQPRIQAMLENLPVEVLLLRRKRTQQAQSLQPLHKETLQELTPSEVFARRLALEDFSTDEQSINKAQILEAFEQVHIDVLQGDGE